MQQPKAMLPLFLSLSLARVVALEVRCPLFPHHSFLSYLKYIFLLYQFIFHSRCLSWFDVKISWLRALHESRLLLCFKCIITCIATPTIKASLCERESERASCTSWWHSLLFSAKRFVCHFYVLCSWAQLLAQRKRNALSIACVRPLHTFSHFYCTYHHHHPLIDDSLFCRQSPQPIQSELFSNRRKELPS